MRQNHREIDENHDCPCESGKTYQTCCKQKGIVWYTTSKGGYGRIDKIEKGAQKPIKQILEHNKERFYTLFGRKPSNGDYLFFDMYNNEDEFIYETVHSLREAGASEDKLYAFYKSGIMLSEYNIDHLPDVDVDMYNSAYDEYNTLMSEELDNNLNVLQLYSLINRSLKNDCLAFLKNLDSSLCYYLHCLYKEKSVGTNVPKTEADFIGFICIKTIRNIRSILTLEENHHPETIYMIIRSLYESYLYISEMNRNPEFFLNKIKPKTDTNNFEFVVNDGKINYNRVVNIHSKEELNVKVNIKDLSYHSDYASDQLLYNILYYTSSSFIHVDVLSAQSYFSDLDPFLQVDKALLASFIGLCISLFILNQIIRSNYVKKKVQKDLLFFYKQIHEFCYKELLLLSADKEQSKDLYSVLVSRLNEDMKIEYDFT